MAHVQALCNCPPVFSDAVFDSGKSTLLAHIVAQMAHGGDVAGRVRAGSALVVSEESALLWCRRRDDLQIGDHVHLLCRPFLGKPAAK